MQSWFDYSLLPLGVFFLYGVPRRRAVSLPPALIKMHSEGQTWWIGETALLWRAAIIHDTERDYSLSWERRGNTEKGGNKGREGDGDERRRNKNRGREGWQESTSSGLREHLSEESQWDADSWSVTKLPYPLKADTSEQLFLSTAGSQGWYQCTWEKLE